MYAFGAGEAGECILGEWGRLVFSCMKSVAAGVFTICSISKNSWGVHHNVLILSSLGWNPVDRRSVYNQPAAIIYCYLVVFPIQH